nr:BEN domain-containing protein 5-like [Misgurnus anguillicaudatus]
MGTMEARLLQAQILMLKENKEDIEEELSKGKRLRVAPLKTWSSPPHTTSSSLKEKAEAKTKNTNQKTASDEGKKQSLLNILHERKAQKRQAPLCSTAQTKKPKEQTPSSHLATDEEDAVGADVVPRKVFEESQKQLQFYQEKLNDVTLQLEKTQTKLEEIEKAEITALRKLNIELQNKLLTLSSSTPVCSEIRETSLGKTCIFTLN